MEFGCFIGIKYELLVIYNYLEFCNFELEEFEA